MIEKIDKEISKVIIGQKDLIQKLLIALFSKGHIILVGVPGLAKTLIIKVIARIFRIKFSRIQFTPDLMPSDLIGYEVLEEIKGKREMKFIKGPVFSNIILADEINRTPPKTQSALLQAMQEKQISVMGKTYDLEEPFFVLATQNPLEFEGTYPLPEAQLDRFMFMLPIDYPLHSEEFTIATKDCEKNIDKIASLFTQKALVDHQEKVLQVKIADTAAKWIVTMVQATRPENKDSLELSKRYLRYGAGPRASQYIIHAAKAAAYLEGSKEVKKHHIEKVIYPVLMHRISLNFSGESENIKKEDIIKKLLEIKLKQ